MAEIKCAQWTYMDTWYYFTRSMKIKQLLLAAIDLHATTRLNLYAPLRIQWPRLNDGDSSPKE